MVFGIGAAIKTGFKIKENKAKIGKLETLVAQLENQQREPFFKNLSGVERFDTLLPLVDATFAHKVKSVRTQADKDSLVRNYLETAHKEFLMAKEELQKIPASRAEVAALGLALREVSVTLDKEIAGLRVKGEEIFKQQASRCSALEEDLRNRIAKSHEDHQLEISARLAREFSQHSEHIETKASENRDVLLAELKRGVAEVNNRTQDLVQENYKVISSEIRDLSESARKELKTEVEARFGRLSADMGRRLDEISAQQTKALEQLNHQIHAMAREQSLFAENLNRQMQQTRKKVFLLASSAIALAAIPLLLYWLR